MIFLKISSATLILSLFAVATISNLLPLSAGFAPSSNSNIAPQAVRRKVLVPRTGVEESLSSTTSSLFAKKILLSFDGTGNSQQDYDPDNDRSITNILKLHLLAGGSIDGKTNHFSDQICLYEKGVGTRPTRKFAKSMRFALGDLNLQIKPMHKRLEDVYDEGDKLYMIGFSRGAASARLFASQLHENGLKTKNGKKVQSPPIEFVGCFDTVSMQVSKNLATISRTRRTKDITPSKVLGEKGVIAPNVKRAVHSLSLDDNRMWTFPMSFNPVLMGAEDKVNEAWFAGEHGDVGGCFLSKGLTDFSIEHMMEWMASSEKLGEDSKLSFLKPEQVSSASLKTGYPNLEIPNEALSIAPDASDQTHLYDPQQTGDDPSYREIVLAQNDDIVPGGLVKIHKSVVLHMEARKQKGLFYPVNKNLKDANFVVVGSLGEELESETKKLAELLKEPAPVMTAAEKEQYLSTDKKLLLS